MTPSKFYDDLTEHYDLIYSDWERSMVRQGEAIDKVLRGLAPPESGPGFREDFRVLDVSAGIGTQTLPLARLGYDMTARDLSECAIARLSREAASRRLSIDSAPADMRQVGDSVEGPFDAILALDNSIPHLLNDKEIRATFRELLELLAPGGALVISVRDYGKIDRTPNSSHPYGERTRDGRVYRVGQSWTWLDDAHYRTTLVVEERRKDKWAEIVRTDAVYYAISVRSLLALMESAGFVACVSDDACYFEPVLVGRAAGAG